MSWLSDLAGKAENILNKIDQNAANVLKSDNEQLIEVTSKCDENLVSPLPKKTNPSISAGYMKLTRTPKKLVGPGKAQDTDINKGENSEKNSLNVSKEEVPSSLSNASNSSRRSSWSSRTEGVTVIEYPIQAAQTFQTVTTSTEITKPVHSTQSNPTTDIERAADKIVLAQVKLERDQFKMNFDELKMNFDELSKQVANNNTDELIANLEKACNDLAAERDQIREKAEAAQSTSNKSISELETTVSKLHRSEQDLYEKLNWASSEKEQAVLELQQYRSRAQHTLQLKDQLIVDLKGAGAVTADSDRLNESQFENLAVLKAERESLLNEVKMLTNQAERQKQNVSILENRCYDLELRLKEREEQLSSSIQQERLRCFQLEDQLQVRTKELNAAREEMTRQQTNYSLKIHER